MTLKLAVAAARSVAAVAGGALVTLALREDVRKREFGSIGYDRDGHVCRITERIDLGGEKASGLFIGVQVMSGRIFSRMPTRGAFEIIPDVFVPALRDGQKIATWLQAPGAAWAPAGTPGELLDANLAALSGLHVDPEARVEGAVVQPAWIGARARVAAGARVGPHTVVSAGAEVGAGAALERTLALPGARVAAGASLIRAIAYGNEVWRDG